jgi:hypothetical protein
MPKNEKGGKHKHLKKNEHERKFDINKLLTPESFNEKDHKGNAIPVFIGICTTVSGGCRFKVKALNDSGLSNIETICLLQKSMSRTGRISVGTLVLYALRSYESKAEDSMKGDIIYIYHADEIPFLKQLELIPKNVESLLDAKNIVTSEVEDSGFDWGTQNVDVDDI